MWKNDRTYCVAECNNTNCDRHYDHIDPKWLLVSLADFSKECKKYRPRKEQR